MQSFTWWENIILAMIVLWVVLSLQRTAKAASPRREQVKSDWMSVLVPLVLVVAFVVFLIKMV